MKLARRSTGSLILTALALGLVVAFSVWCIGLTVTVTRLREDVASNVKVLVAIEDLRAVISDLDRIALMPSDAPADERLASWRKTYAHADEQLGVLDAEPLALPAQTEVARIRSVIETAITRLVSRSNVSDQRYQ